MKEEKRKQPKWIIYTVAVTKFALGIEEDQRYRVYQLCHVILYLTTCSINVIGCTVAVLNNSSFKAKFVVSLFLTFHIFTIVYFYTITVKKRKRVISIIDRFLANSPNYIGMKSERLLAKFIKYEIIVSTSLYLCCLICYSTLILFFKDEQQDRNVEWKFVDDFHDYTIPLWYSCGDKTSDSISKLLCWKVDNERELLLCNITQIILLAYQCAYFYFALLGIIFLTRAAKAKAITFRNEMKAMEVKTTAITTVVKKSGKVRCDTKSYVMKYDEVVWEKFQKMLLERSVIQRFVGEMMSVLREEMFCCTLCNFSFVLLATAGIFADINGGIYFRMRCTCMALLTLYLYYELCDNMHYIYDMNGIISDAFYDFCWYNQSIKFKKLFIISLLVNQQTTMVKILSTYVVNLSYFADSVKRLWSVIALLRLKASTTE